MQKENIKEWNELQKQLSGKFQHSLFEKLFGLHD